MFPITSNFSPGVFVPIPTSPDDPSTNKEGSVPETPWPFDTTLK